MNRTSCSCIDSSRTPCGACPRAGPDPLLTGGARGLGADADVDVVLLELVVDEPVAGRDVVAVVEDNDDVGAVVELEVVDVRDDEVEVDVRDDEVEVDVRDDEVEVDVRDDEAEVDVGDDDEVEVDVRDDEAEVDVRDDEAEVDVGDDDVVEVEVRDDDVDAVLDELDDRDDEVELDVEEMLEPGQPVVVNVRASPRKSCPYGVKDPSLPTNDKYVSSAAAGVAPQ